jgi:hypothetical protein
MNTPSGLTVQTENPLTNAGSTNILLRCRPRTPLQPYPPPLDEIFTKRQSGVSTFIHSTILNYPILLSKYPLHPINGCRKYAAIDVIVNTTMSFSGALALKTFCITLAMSHAWYE